MKRAIVALALSVFGFPAAANADCGEVSITQMNWASSAIVTEVSKFIMANGYGCDVTGVPSDTIPAVTSVAETGEPDIVTELWLNSAPAYSKLEKQGKVKTLGDVRRRCRGLVDSSLPGRRAPRAENHRGRAGQSRQGRRPVPQLYRRLEVPDHQ